MIGVSENTELWRKKENLKEKERKIEYIKSRDNLKKERKKERKKEI